MAAASAATVEFGPQILWLDKELLQVLAAGNKVLLEELLRGEGGTHPARTNGQVAISFHGTSEPAARRGTSRLLGVTSNGSTALHVVASHGHAELAALICERAPSLAATRNRSLDTPLHCASKAGHRDVAACLLRVMDQATPRSRNLTGATALHEAVRHGHVEVVDLLMTTDPWLASVTTNGGVSPLYMAFRSLNSVNFNCKPEIAQEILNWPEGPSLLTRADSSGRTPLHFAVIYGRLDTVKLFLGGDAASPRLTSISDSDGSYPVHAAAMFGRTKIIDELVKKCPNYYELVDDKGRNLLHIAVESEQEMVVRHICGNDMFAMLLNATDYDGNTPLHLAVKQGYPRIFGLLLGTRGVDMCIMNKDGHTARDISCCASTLERGRLRYFLLFVESRSQATRWELGAPVDTDTAPAISPSTLDLVTGRRLTAVVRSLRRRGG
uniref:Uncharacterized protein n=1 Tax=Oryza glaberrima TaxID=4538 RepID=I1QE53_ORYGL